MKLNIISPLVGTSGYVNHSRGLINELSKIHDIKISSNIPRGYEFYLTDRELECLKKPDSPDRINLIIDLPHHWLPYLKKRKNIGFLVFEGDRIPLHWLEICKDERISQIWVPSNHVLQAVKNTINWPEDKSWQNQQLLSKIKIVPHGYNPDIFYPKKIKTDIFTFFCNKGFRNELDRGGMQYAIRAFLEEFKKNEAQLILKINLAYAMPPQDLQDLITKYVKEIGLKDEEVPQINIVYNNISMEDLAELYNRCDVYLNPTRAEAFGMPCIEAMACGKPVITSNFGGQMDYCNEENSFIIGGEMTEIKHEILYEGIRWLTPNISELRKAMRKAFSSDLSEKSKKALETAKHWTWKNSAERASQWLKEIE